MAASARASAGRPLALWAVAVAISATAIGCDNNDDNFGESGHLSTNGGSAEASSTCVYTVSQPWESLTRYCNSSAATDLPLPHDAIFERYERGSDLVSATLKWEGSTYKTPAPSSVVARDLGGFRLTLDRVSGSDGPASVCAIYFANNDGKGVTLNEGDGSCPHCHHSDASSTVWVLVDGSFADVTCPTF